MPAYIQNNDHSFMYIVNKHTWQLPQEGLDRVAQESTTGELQMTVYTNRGNHQILDVARALLVLHTKDRSFVSTSLPSPH